ncbi:MAG: transglycosylase SLT domain-containing protein [bacterium]
MGSGPPQENDGAIARGTPDPARRDPGAGERTVVEDGGAEADAGPIHVAWRGGEAGEERCEATFHDAFTLGRDPRCDISLTDSSVSRSHARVHPAAGRWHVEDLGSGNGTLLDDVRIREAVVPRSATLQLGTGTRILLQAPNAPAEMSEETIARRYFGADETGEVGGRTRLLRDAYRRVDRRQKRRYRVIIAGIAALLVASFGVGLHQYRALARTRELATEIFYSMKAVELQVARIEERVREAGDPALLDEMEIRREEVRALEREYDRFLEELDVLGAGLSEQDRVILRVARLFGECELTMPPDFVAEVKRYIHEWRLSPRLERAIERMHAQSLTPLVVEAMLEQHLPPQFLYLALQESSFDNDAVGPKTRFGIAKGIWQFIPSTARRYGLRTGPLVELPVADPNDDRHAPELATRAAARYLRDIYSRDAQASGLLVMASYNWGPNNIRRRIREMPANPRERNFWALLKKDEVPRETYDYVFHIVAAAVIGEAPELFGFDFENPLRDVVETLADGS